MAEELPLFPLDHVLLPGSPLPLHVFEPRYRQLVADVSTCAVDGAGRFGVVLGWAAAREAFPRPVSSRSAAAVLPSPAGGTGAQLADIGTVAEIVENEPYPDGRCDLLTVGSRRFRVLEIDTTTRPYVSASVEYLDEPVGGDVPRLVRRARALTDRYLAALSDVSDDVDAPDADGYHDGAAIDATRLSYQIAAQIQLTLPERQGLLCAPSATDRLRAEICLMRRELAIFSHVTAVPVPARTLVIPAGAN